MAVPPAERDKALNRTGVRLLAIGVVLIVIGLALAIPFSGTAAGVGVAVAALGAVPAMGGVGLIFSAVVSRRSRAGKPFA